MSASGLPGRRVEARRAGMRTRTSGMARGRGGADQSWDCPLIRVARASANRLFVRRNRQAAQSFHSGADEAMDSFELNKILGAILATCLGLLTVNLAAGAIFAPGKMAKPGYDIAVQEERPGGPAQPA